jgi:divalent metal cation (Fe/Co/Zn/Cd) transporter
VVEVLQQEFARMLGIVSTPHPSAAGHDHGHRHGHEHPEPGPGLAARVRHLLRPHSHEAADQIDAAMETSKQGMRTLWISLAILGATALIQAAVVALSGSVALLGDTLHNAADALTAVPLAGRVRHRPPTADPPLHLRLRPRRGPGRDRDRPDHRRLLRAGRLRGHHPPAAPQHVSDLLAVAAAALIGFAGNELVATYRIRTGRKIGSAALAADGLHARTDELTSLAVLLGADGVALGWNWADPAVGLVITVAILAVLRQAAREIHRRLMDAVDPALIDQAEQTLRATPGVLDTGQVRIRWIGHNLRAECEVVVDPGNTAIQAHQVTVAAEHNLLHAIPRLSAALVHADPQPHGETDFHQALAAHRRSLPAWQ